MKKRLFLFCLLTFLFVAFANATNKFVSSYPINGQKVKTLSSIDLKMDCSETYAAYSDYTPAEIGLCACFTKTSDTNRQLFLYKGDVASGELLETLTKTVTGELGKEEITFSLSQEYELEDGQLYTIYIPENCIWTYHTQNKAKNRLDKSSPAITITLYGGKEEGSISFVSSSPQNCEEVAKLGKLTLNFDGEINLAENAQASLYANDELVKSVPLDTCENDNKTAIADFGDEALSSLYTYTVTVPKESVLLKGTTTSLGQDISLTFKGGTYELFGYRYISPDSGTVCSQIGTVSIIPEWPDGCAGFINYSTGSDTNPWEFEVKLYQGTDSTGTYLSTHKLDLNGGGTALRVNVSRKLEPNTQYALVFLEGLIPALKWNATGSNGVKMEAYHSAPLTLVYTGANSPLDGKWSVTENDQLSKLGIVSFMTGGTATASEGAKMEIYNGEDSIASATLNASGTLCYADFGGLALEKGAEYSLVIPDSAIVNMPKTTQKFKGIAKPAEYASVSYKAGNTTIVADSVLVGSKVAFNVAASDTLALDSLTLNGAAVALTDSAYVIDSIAANADLAASLRYIPTPAPETVYYNVDYKIQSVVNDSTTPIASSTTKVAEDSIFTFCPATLDENWTVAVSAGELADSTYSLTIASDTTVTVTYTFNGEVKYVDETTTGVYMLENSQEIKISASQGKIVVSGAKAGDKISLYGLNGAKLGNWEVKQDRQTIDVNSGVYLVVVNGDNGKAAAKVSVK